MYILGNNSLIFLFDTLCQSLYSTKLFKLSRHKLHMKQDEKTPHSLCLKSHEHAHCAVSHSRECFAITR